MNFFPDIEKQPQQIIKSFQETEMKKLLLFVNEFSPFYKNHFAKHGININSINSLEDFKVIPPTTKEDLHNSNWDFLCVPKSKIVEYTSTSGTLGKPVTIALTEKDLQRLAYNEAISFACAGASADDVFQLMLTLDRQFMAGLAYHEGIRKLGSASIRIGPGLPAMQWDSISRLKPTTLVAVPSFILKLIEYAKYNGINPNHSTVKKIICIGENLRTPELQFNTLAKKITEDWNVALIGTYASTEMQTAFTECAHSRGGHHHPELVMVELLDEENIPVPADTVGEVTITTLGVEGMPLLRYKTGDIAQAYYEPCACGRTTMRLGPVLGRKQQMIKLRGTTVYPPAIFDLLNQIEAVTDYAVEVHTNDLGVDELKIHITSSNERKSEVSAKEIFQSRLRIIPELIFCSLSDLESIHSRNMGRKVQRFIDHRKK